MSAELAPQPQVKIVWIIGIVAAFAIFVVIANYSSRMTNDYSDYDQQRAEQRYETLKKVQSTEQALINPVDAQGNPDAEWVDQTKGVVRIPIQEAMAEEVEALKGQQAAMGCEIAGATPAAATPAPPAPATPPPPDSKVKPPSPPPRPAPHRFQHPRTSNMATLFPTIVAPRGFASTDPELAAVDRSVRWPVMVCFLSAVHWMVVGTFLLVYAASLTHPQDTFPILGWFVDLSNNFSMFTYGRVWPAGIDALVYGWAGTSGLGLAVWLLARMSREPVFAPGALMTAVIFWNLGVAVGLTAIFVGDSTGVELLEFPFYASAILWIAYVIFALWAVAVYLQRRSGNDHIAQAWVLTALFSFPWLYAAGAILLSSRPLPGSGVIQELINAWYVHGIYTLWLAPLGLGTIYYLIPKVSGISIHFGTKAKLAFWTWIIFAPWTAVHDLVGGPFPAETVTIGLILSGLTFIPVALIGLNLVSTAFVAEEQQGHHGGVVFPFLVLASVAFVLAGISEQILSIRSANELLRFTMFRECNTFIWIYGFFSFTVFGAIYYIVPRLLDFGWRSAMMVRIHYYTSLYGILLVIALLGFGGFMQGTTLENPDPQVTMLEASSEAISFHIAATMCISLIALGNGVFALHLGWMLIDWLRLRVRGNRLASEILVEPYDGDAPKPVEKEVAA